MALFKGTIQEFHCHIGPRIRNAINSLTRKERLKRKGVCEFCKENATLDSAHVHGKGRREIIEKVLKEHLDGNIVSIADLDKIEQTILDAHLPLSSTFKFICKPCHTEYDSDAPRPRGEVKMSVKHAQKTDGDNHLKILQGVGIETFITYFEQFNAHTNKELTQILIDNHGYGKDSASTKVSKGKKIVNNPDILKECLDYIVEKAARVSNNIRDRAQELRTEISNS